MDNTELGKIYVCQSCASSFRSQNGLKAHTEIFHQGIRFPCNICEKVFTSPHTLKGHMGIHTGERPYVC